jgi:hypothetical protein
MRSTNLVSSLGLLADSLRPRRIISPVRLNGLSILVVGLCLCWGSMVQAQTKFKCSDANARGLAAAISKNNGLSNRGAPTSLGGSAIKGDHAAPIWVKGGIKDWGSAKYQKTRARNKVYNVMGIFPERRDGKFRRGHWGPHINGVTAKQTYNLTYSKSTNQKASFHFCSYWVGWSKSGQKSGRKAEPIGDSEVVLTKSKNGGTAQVRVHHLRPELMKRNRYGEVVSFLVVSPESYVRELSYEIKIKPHWSCESHTDDCRRGRNKKCKRPGKCSGSAGGKMARPK